MRKVWHSLLPILYLISNLLLGYKPLVQWLPSLLRWLFRIYFDRKQRLDEQQTEANQKQKFFIALLPTIYQLQNTTDAIKTLESEYLNLIPVFAKELHIFVHGNIYDEPLNQLAFELFHSEEILSQYLQHGTKMDWAPTQFNAARKKNWSVHFTNYSENRKSLRRHEYTKQ